MSKLILASNSARRQQLMREAGFDFEVMVRDFDERFDQTMLIEEVAEYLANKKNKGYRELLTDEIVVTADTIVIADREILGKPEDKNEAFQMIKKMSGKVHEVVSGVAISSKDKIKSFSDVVEVHLNELSDDEIHFYIENYEPYDKAGAYGIQEWIGMVGISAIKGSFYTVMGLPVHKVYETLKKDFKVLPFQNLSKRPSL